MSEYESKGQQLASQGAAAWLNGLFERLELDVSATETETDEALEIDIQGPDSAVLLAAQGKALGALLTVTGQVALPKELRRKELTMDVDGYRERKQEVLKDMAHVVGEQVQKLNKPVTIIGLDAFERRAVHSVFSEEGGLQTESTGYGSFRRLKISQR